MFDLTARRQLNRGFSDGFTRAVEIVASPVLMGLIGYVIDRWAGTGRLFTIGLAVIGVAGIFTKLWLGYDREMKAEEAKLPGHRPATAGLVEAPEQAPDEVEP